MEAKNQNESFHGFGVDTSIVLLCTTSLSVVTWCQSVALVSKGPLPDSDFPSFFGIYKASNQPAYLTLVFGGILGILAFCLHLMSNGGMPLTVVRKFFHFALLGIYMVGFAESVRKCAASSANNASLRFSLLHPLVHWPYSCWRNAYGGTSWNLLPTAYRSLRHASLPHQSNLRVGSCPTSIFSSARLYLYFCRTGR